MCRFLWSCSTLVSMPHCEVCSTTPNTGTCSKVVQEQQSLWPAVLMNIVRACFLENFSSGIVARVLQLLSSQKRIISSYKSVEHVWSKRSQCQSVLVCHVCENGRHFSGNNLLDSKSAKKKGGREREGKKKAKT